MPSFLRLSLSAALLFLLGGIATRAAEIKPGFERRLLAVKDVCAWPNLTKMKDGTIIAVIHNQPAHGLLEGDVEAWASSEGVRWEKRGLVTHHEPSTIRMNHAAGSARNGDLVVLCSGWTDLQQPGQPKKPKFRDAVLRPWVLRSADGGRTWSKSEAFPAPEPGWGEYIPFGDIWTSESGALYASCYQGMKKQDGTPVAPLSLRSSLLRSDDDGRTWRFASIIGPSHNETDIFPLGGKRWLAAAREETRREMDLLESSDDGQTWSKPRAVTAKAEVNGHLNRLTDGRLLLSYGVRVDGRRGVCAKLSEDEGKTWGDPIRIADTAGSNDCGYPSSVQRGDGKIVTAWYSKKSDLHDGYHMGVTIWEAPARKRKTAGIPAQPGEFRHARIIDAWTAYADRLSFGKGQTLALVDDGCKMSMPEWTAVVDGIPKVRVTHDAVDGDSDPKHEGKGYHGSTIGIPSSVNHANKWGVAYNNQVAVIRGLECCHCKVEDGKPLAAALQWIIDHHREYAITTVNLAPVDDLEHGVPVPTPIDEKLTKLRELGIWVSAPTGNHAFTKGISWPASQPNCFAIGAVRTGKDEVHLDRHAKVDLVVPAGATSSSNAIACGSAMILREAIDKFGFDWKAEGKTLPDALMAIFQKTGVPVTDPGTMLTFRRLDLKAALDYVTSRGKP